MSLLLLLQAPSGVYRDGTGYRAAVAYRAASPAVVAAAKSAKIVHSMAVQRSTR